MGFEDMKRKLDSKYKKDEPKKQESKKQEKAPQVTKSTGASASGNTGATVKTTTTTQKAKNPFDDFRSRMEMKYNPNADIDDTFLDSFLNDAKGYLDRTQSDYEQMGGKSYQSAFQSRLEATTDLQRRSNTIRSFLNRNKDNLDPEQYQSTIAYLDELGRAMDDSFGYFRDARDTYESLYGRSPETMDAMGAEGFRDLSQYASTKSDDWWERAWSQYSMGYNDLTYEYINNQEGIRDEISRKSRAYGADTHKESSFARYDYMTDDEIAVYNYYYARDGKDRAEEYLDSIGAALEARSNHETVGKVSKFADAHPVLSSAMSVGTSLGSGFEYIQDVLTYGAEKLQGRDTRLGTNEAALMTNAVRGTVSDKVDWEIKGWDAFDFLYSTAMSGVDSMAASAFGNFGGAVLGLSAAAQGTNDALDRGMSDGQAFWNGLFSGVFEGLFESVSIGNFNKLKEVAPESVKDIIKNLGKSMLVNASEETLTELANITYDTIINGEFANYTWEELKAGAWKDALQQVIEAGASGALMGVGMGGVGNAIGYFKGNHEAKQNYGEFQHDLVGEALEIDPENAYAKQMQERLDGGKDLKGSQLRKLVSQNDAAIAAHGDAAWESDAQEYGGMLENAEMTEESAQEGTAGYAEKAEGKAKTFTLEEVSGKYGAQAQAMVKTFREGQDVAKYDAAYKNAYDMGKSGVSMDYAKNSPATAYLTAEQVELAYEAGTAAQNSFEASGEGKTLLQKDGTTVSIQGIESVSGGSMKLKLEDGRTVDASEVAFSSADEAMVYDAVAKMDLDGATAELLVGGYKTSGIPANAYAIGIQQAYRYGQKNFPQADLNRAEYAAKLTEEQRMAAYEAGSAAEYAKAEKAQATVAKNATTESRQGRVQFLDGGQVKDLRSHLNQRGGKLKAVQETAIGTMEKLSAAMGVNFYVFESYKKDGKRLYIDENGVERPAPSGKYRGGSGEIYIDLNAGNQGQGIMLYTVAHELTHFIRDWSPAKFKTMADILMAGYAAQGQSVQELVDNQIAKAKRNGRTIDFDTAYEEVVADSMEAVLASGNVVQMMADVKKQDQTLWQKICDWFRNLAEDLKAMVEAYKGVTPDSREARLVTEVEGFLDTLEMVYGDALMDAGANYQASEQVGIEIDQDTESVSPAVVFSERTWTESDYVQERKTAAAEIAKAIGVSQKKAMAYIDSVNSIAKMIAEDRVRLDYFSSPGRSSFMNNAEYGGSFDFSTLCKKRRLLTGTFTAIQKALPNTALTANEILDIRNRMKDAGLEVSCGLCYVEGSRANMGQFAKAFLKLYKQYFPDAWQPNMADVNTPDGIEWVRINHPECYEQYEYFWNHYGTLKDGDKNLFASHQKPKLYQLHTEYKGEILSKFKDDDNVEEKNLNGGIRLQSFSDFEIVHLIDTMQIIMDMSRVGLAGQAYTKVPDFAWALGDTGLKINLSLIAKGVDGNGQLIFDDVEGMPIKEAMALRDRYSKNVGTILVAFNDEQLMAAMADERVDFIIPFRRSQWKKSQYAAMGLPARTKDYTYMQNEKFIKPQYHEYRGRMVRDRATNYMPNEYWDFSKSGRENAIAYLQMCARNNKRPKFYKLLKDNGDGSYSLKADGSTDGYWKLLIDFKMYDNSGKGSPQTSVKPVFNMEEATRMLETYQGGHSNFPVAQGIVDEFVEEYKESHKGVKFSDRDSLEAVDTDSFVVDNGIINRGKGDGRVNTDSEGNALTEKQSAFFAHSKARDRDGKLLVLYHGTANAGFTAFDPGKGRLGGNWFTTSRKDADTYAGNYQHKLFDPDERDEVRSGVGGSYMLGSWMRFDTEADREAFRRQYPSAETIKTDAEYEELMQKADDAGDYDEYERLEEEQLDRRNVLKQIQRAYGRYEWEHSREATLQELFDNPEQFSMSDVLRAWDAYDSNNSADEDGATKEDLIEALRAIDQEGIEQGDDSIADIRFKARLPVGDSGQVVNRANNRTYAVYVNAVNPYEIDARSQTLHGADLYPTIEAGMKDSSYDSVIVRNARVGAHGETGDVVIIKDGGQVKLTSNKAPAEGTDIRFSERDPEAEKVNEVLRKENAELKYDITHLKELLKLQRQVTGGTKFTRSSVEAAAGHLMKYANSRGDKREFAGLLNHVYEYIAGGKELTWDGVKEAAQPAVDWLRANAVTRKEQNSYAQDVLKEIRGSRVYLDEQQKQEVAHLYGSFNDFRKKAMGSVILTDKDAVALDTKWQEWASLWPNIFDPETGSNDMPAAMMEAFERLRSMTEVDAYGYDAELFAQDLLSQVYDSYWKVSTLRTVADSKQKEINRLKGEHAKRMANLREFHKEKTAQLKAEHRESLKKVRQEARERAEKKLQEQSQRYQASRDKATDNRRKTEMRRKIRRTIRDLDKLLNRGDKNRNVKEGMKDLVSEVLRSADVLFTDHYSNEDMVRNGVGTDLTEQEAKYLNEARELMEQIGNLPSGSYEAFLERQEQETKLQSKLSYRMTKLQDVFARERARLAKAEVSKVLGDLADAYKGLEKSEDGYIKGAFHENVYQYLLAVKAEVGGTLVRDMSLNQLDDLYRAYTMVLTTVRNANRMFAQNLKQTREQLGSQVIGEVKKAGGEHGLWFPGEDKISAFSWNNQKPIYAFERIGSETLTRLFENTRAGEDTWAKDMAEARGFYLEQVRKHRYDCWDFKKQHKFTSPTGTEFSLNLEQIMSLYAYSKREQAHDHLMKGGFVFDGNTEVQVSKMGIKLTYLNKSATAHKISPDLLGQIVGKLTAEQKAFVDEMQDYLSTTMGGKGNSVSMELYGVKLFNEKHYFPLRSAGQYMERAKEADLKKQQGQISIVNSGFAKSTTPKASNPVVLSGFMDVWADHVNEMSMYHSFVLPMEDFRRVYNYASPNTETGQSVSVNSTIQDAYGEAATNYIDQLYRDLNGGAVSDPRETTAKSLMGKFKKAAVFASASVVVQQPSAIGRAFAIIDPKYFVGGRIGAKRHNALWAELKQYAPVAAIKEMGYFDTGMGKSAQDYIKGKEYKGIKEKAAAIFTDGNYRDELLGKAPALADELTWCAIWDAAKRETKARNPRMDVKSEEFLAKAGQRFTEVIVKTQVYDSVLSRSANMRSKGAFMSMWTAFMAEPTTTINMMEDALRKGKKGDKRYAARATGAVLGSIILNSALASLVYAMRDDDEDETFLEKYGQSFATEILDGINPLTYYPFLKDVWSALQGFDIERSDMSLITSLVEKATKLVQVYGKDTEGMDEEELAAHGKDIANAWWGVVDYLTALVGIPVKNVRRDINGAFNTYSTISADLTDRDTSWGSFTDKVLGEVKNSIPVIGWLPDKTAADRLYEATVGGDTAYQKRLASSYRTENSLNNAIRKGLRVNDSRIWEAAVAWNENDLETYKRIAKEIVAEGHFSQDNVVAAIQAEAKAMLPKESEDSASKAKGYFTAEKFAVAISQGNNSMASIIREDIIATAQLNGKTQEEAEKSFASSARTKVEELFQEGSISTERAIKALTDYCGKTQEEASEAVAKWRAEKETGIVYNDIDDAFMAGEITESEAREMYMTYGGYSEEKATEKAGSLAFEREYPELSERITYTQYKRWQADGEPNGVDIEVFTNVAEFRDDGTSGKTRSQEEVAEYIDSLPVSTAQKDALWCCFWKASTLKNAPWH